MGGGGQEIREEFRDGRTEEITEWGIEKEPCFFVLKQGLDALLTFMLSSVLNHLKVAVFLLPQGPDTQN